MYDLTWEIIVKAIYLTDIDNYIYSFLTLLYSSL